jgi:CheY-like chemotaxis protein
MISNIFELIPHLLIISDKPRVLAELKKALRGCFHVSIASTGSASGALMSAVYNAVIICVDGGEINASLPIFEQIVKAASSVPVLFLTEWDDERDELTAFDIGAADYLIRRRDNQEVFKRRLTRCIGPLTPTRANAYTGGLILIAEDIEINREIVTAMLEDEDGITLEFACDGREAVQKYREYSENAALILMDIQMPEMDGLQAAYEIRKLSDKVPIIALTAGTDEEEIKKIKEAGMDGFLEKPVEYEQLIKVMSYYIGGGNE